MHTGVNREGKMDKKGLSLIKVNGEYIEMCPNRMGHYRGLHIVVINTPTGEFEYAKVFDTYKSSSSIDEFINQDFTPGHIVLAACMDQCVNNLSYEANHWFWKMGSKEICSTIGGD